MRAKTQNNKKNKFYSAYSLLFVLSIIILSSSFSIFIILTSSSSNNLSLGPSSFSSLASSQKSIKQQTKKKTHSISPDDINNNNNDYTEEEEENNSCFTWTSINGKKSYNSCEVEPIDAVYTWVNGSDPLHEVARERFILKTLKKKNKNKNNHNTTTGDVIENMTNGNDNESKNETASSDDGNEDDVDDDRTAINRFADNNELLYSLRGLEEYAGDWIRQVFIVTNGQVPTWLNLQTEKSEYEEEYEEEDNQKAEMSKIQIVTHLEIYSQCQQQQQQQQQNNHSYNCDDHLPVFSSSSIETHLHRIQGLSSRFLYLNDDTFFGNKVVLDDFYCPVAGNKVFLSWAVPLCNEGCQPGWVGDNYCDAACNNEACDWDGGDCNKSKSGAAMHHNHDHITDENNNNNNHHQQECSPGCQITTMMTTSTTPIWIGDNFCDKKCNTSSCGFDGGDCGLEYFREIGREYTVSTPLGTDTNSSENVVVELPPSILSSSSSESVDESNSYYSSILINMSSLVTVNNKIESAFLDSSSELCTNLIRLSLLSQDSSSLILIFSKPNIRNYVKNHIDEICSANNNQSGSSLSLTSSSMVCFAGFEVRNSSSSPVTNPSHEAEILINLNISFQQVFESYCDELMMLNNNSIIDHNQKRTKTQNLDDRIIKENHPPLDSILPENNNNNEIENMNNNDGDVGDRELLLDAFGESLKYSNRLLNHHFGNMNQPRKAPAHMVHLIEKDVINKLWKMMPSQWNSTSASRFRSGENVQYGFLHMYFMMHAKMNYDTDVDADDSDANEHPHDIFFDRYLDVDHSGKIEENELRRIGLLLYDKKVPLETLLERNVQRQPEDDNEDKNVAAINTQVGEQQENSSSTTTLNSSSSSPPSIIEHEFNSSSSNSSQKSQQQKYEEEDSYLIDDDGPDDPSTHVLLPEEKVIPMNSKYLRAVTDLVGQANAGIKYDLCVNNDEDDDHSDGDDKQQQHNQQEGPSSLSSSLTSSRQHLTASRFRNSHLAKLITPLFSSSSSSDPQYVTELQTLDDVTFFMIRDNATVARHQMDHIIQKRPKFFCINDNMNRTRKSFPRVFKILSEFFEMYFPKPSSFEKVPHSSNCGSGSETLSETSTRKSYIWQYPSWLKRNNNNKEFGALARALQYGYTKKEFEADKERFLQEFVDEVSLKKNREEEGGAKKSHPSSSFSFSSHRRMESVKFILAISGFLILLVMITAGYAKFVATETTEL